MAHRKSNLMYVGFEDEHDRDIIESYENLITNMGETQNTKIPAIKSKWRHTNGIKYKVIAIANEENTEKYPITVVYKGKNGKIWSRLLTDWHRSFTEL